MLNRSLCHPLFNNLRQTVTAIHQGKRCRLQLTLVSLAYFTFITRYLVISFCLHYDLATYFTSVDVIAGQLMYRSAVHRRSNYYLMHTLEAAFAARLIALNLFSENSKNGRIVWSHLYDLLVRNSQKEKRQKSKEGKNHLTSFTSPTLHHYPQLSASIRRKCCLIIATSETLFSVLFAFYLLLLSHTLLQTAIRAGLNTLPQLFFLLTAVAPVNITCALFGLLHILLTATALLLVATAHSAEYRAVNGALTKGITKTLKSFNSRNHKSNHNRLETTLNLVCATKKFRTCHAYLTTFLLRYNSAIISRVITAYLHLVLPVHAYREVFFYFQQQSYVPFSYRLNKTLYQAVSWAFLGTLTALLAQLNAKIGHAGQSGLLAAVFARKGKLDFETELGGKFHKESLSFPETVIDVQRRRKRGGKMKNNGWTSKCDAAIWRRESLKLATVYEALWRREKELAFTAGQANAAMSWRFILELAVSYSSFVLFFGGKFISKH